MIVETFLEKISFEEGMWLEKYIGFNTQKQINAKNEFENYFFKLPNISFYGKTKRSETTVPDLDSFNNRSDMWKMWIGRSGSGL